MFLVIFMLYVFNREHHQRHQSSKYDLHKSELNSCHSAAAVIYPQSYSIHISIFGVSFWSPTNCWRHLHTLSSWIGWMLDFKIFVLDDVIRIC